MEEVYKKDAILMVLMLIAIIVGGIVLWINAEAIIGYFADLASEIVFNKFLN